MDHELTHYERDPRGYSAVCACGWASENLPQEIAEDAHAEHVDEQIAAEGAKAGLVLWVEMGEPATAAEIEETKA